MIDVSKWKVTLPLYRPEGVLDNSTIQAYSNCPTYGFYRYGLRRGFEGKSWAIQYGSAYHKFREVLEKLMAESGVKGANALTQEIISAATKSAIAGWEDPPLDHKHSHLDFSRLVKAFEITVDRIREERRTGRIIVTRSEDSFDLEHDFWICPNGCEAWLASEVDIDEEAPIIPTCGTCGTQLFCPRHGGRIDQIVIFSAIGDAQLIRDFKTTGMMGKNYTEKFDPNGQMQGYVWGGGRLSGREFDGALIETIYNTKKEGPKISQHYVQYTRGQLERWEASMMEERRMLLSMWNNVERLGYLAFPQRTSQCQNFGGCEFREPCRAGSGYEIETWLKNYTVESHWDFLKDLEEVL